MNYKTLCEATVTAPEANNFSSRLQAVKILAVPAHYLPALALSLEMLVSLAVEPQIPILEPQAVSLKSGRSACKPVSPATSLTSTSGDHRAMQHHSYMGTSKMVGQDNCVGTSVRTRL